MLAYPDFTTDSDGGIPEACDYLLYYIIYFFTFFFLHDLFSEGCKRKSCGFKALLLSLSRLIHIVGEKKKAVKNMTILIKQTNYSPSAAFKAIFYWPIQPNKSFTASVEKGTVSFLHSFPKHDVYVLPVMTPL